jgi:hypothetical protein
MDLVLILALHSRPEPRFQVSETLETRQVFGADVDGARTVVIDGSTLGYPREHLDRVSPGEYFVQAALNVYQTFHRADGRTSGRGGRGAGRLRRASRSSLPGAV